MSTLKVGIASYDEMKALTLAIARGQRKLAPQIANCCASLRKMRPAPSTNWLNSPAARSPISRAH